MTLNLLPTDERRGIHGGTRGLIFTPLWAVAIGKLGWFELAGHRFESPTVVFGLEPRGPLGDPYVEGNLGVEFLKPFKIVLDFPHERVALVSQSR